MGASIALLVVGLLLLVLGAELLVRAASWLAGAIGVPPLVIGLTVVAYGTSAPELAVSVRAGLAGTSDLALGNVVGSNIFNVLLILGISALIAPLAVSRQLVRLDVPIMIGASVLVIALGADGAIGTPDAALLLALAVVYSLLQIVLGRREGDPDGEGARGTRGGSRGWPLQLGVLALGLVLLVAGSRWLVDGAVAIARAVGVGELVIGLTVVAAGTSLPELATSLIAVLRGERDMAVGNVVGSNIFNLLVVLGAAGLATAGGVAVVPAALRFDLPVMLAVAIACLPVFFSGYRIARWEGGIFVGYYLFYTVYLLQAASGRAVTGLEGALLWFALPLTALTLLVVAGRELRRPPPAAP